MSALESLIASSGEAPIHSALDFSLPPSSTAVVDRKQHVRAYPTSASTLTINGTRTLRLRLGGDDFIDPASIRVLMTINNTDPVKIMYPRTGPWGCWQQVYCRSAGAEIDNIPYYNRFHTQFGFNHLTQQEQFGVVGIEGLHCSAEANNRPRPGTLLQGTSLTCMHKLHLSLLSSGKLLPTRYCPLEIELSLISSAGDWLDLSDANYSSSFTISDVQLLYDCYVLDEAVQNSFYSALLKNQVLAIPVMNAYQVVQAIPAGATQYDFSSVRAFSRLSQVWLTFRGTGARATEFIAPANLPGEITATPVGNTAVPTARLSIGPKNYPEGQPVTTMAEHYYQFQKALGHIPNMTRWLYEAECFTMVFDLKRMPTDPTSALSTRSGDLVRIELKNLLADRCTEVWVTMLSFDVVAIRESGVTLLS